MRKIFDKNFVQKTTHKAKKVKLKSNILNTIETESINARLKQELSDHNWLLTKIEGKNHFNSVVDVKKDTIVPILKKRSLSPTDDEEEKDDDVKYTMYYHKKFRQIFLYDLPKKSSAEARSRVVPTLKQMPEIKEEPEVSSSETKERGEQVPSVIVFNSKLLLDEKIRSETEADFNSYKILTRGIEIIK